MCDSERFRQSKVITLVAAAVAKSGRGWKGRCAQGGANDTSTKAEASHESVPLTHKKSTFKFGRADERLVLDA